MIYPNTLEGLFWGLKNFDAIEFDIRLTKDKQLVIFHNPATDDGRPIRELLAKEVKEEGIPLLEDLFSIPAFQELCKLGRQLFIELKPDCTGKKRVTTTIAQEMKDAFDVVVNKTAIIPSCINIISFCEELLQAFLKDYPCYPLLPDVNECAGFNSTLRVLLSVIGPFMRRSLGSIMRRMKKDGFSGVFFAREYIMGFLSFRHPSIDKLVKLSKELDFEIGCNFGVVELEPDYPDFYRFSDKTTVHPRHANTGEGLIIAHRGTGTKGVDIEFSGFVLD